MARHQVNAQIAGSVWSHVATVGQHVANGTVLLIMELMKTEIPIESPVTGTVAWLRACGEAIESGDLVAIVETT